MSSGAPLCCPETAERCLSAVTWFLLSLGDTVSLSCEGAGGLKEGLYKSHSHIHILKPTDTHTYIHTYIYTYAHRYMLCIHICSHIYIHICANIAAYVEREREGERERDSERE